MTDSTATVHAMAASFPSKAVPAPVWVNIFCTERILEQEIIFDFTQEFVSKYQSIHSRDTPKVKPAISHRGISAVGRTRC